MRRLLALAVIAAAVAAPAASANDLGNKIIRCTVENNRIPDPGYGGWVIKPVPTAVCIAS